MATLVSGSLNLVISVLFFVFIHPGFILMYVPLGSTVAFKAPIFI